MSRILRLILTCASVVMVAVLVYMPGNLDAHARTHADENVIYKSTKTTGTDAVINNSSYYYYYREKCKVHTDFVITSILHNGHKRNNPDGTFYPGDAFEYEINVRVEGCSIVKPCNADLPPNSAETECEVLEAVCVYVRRGGCKHVGFTGYGGSGPRFERGTVFIPSDIYGPDESYTVTKKTYAMAKVITRSIGSAHEGYSLVTSVASFPIRVIDPDLSITLSHRPLVDSSGYAAANLDSTYYVWDPINIVHVVDYQWKDERMGTIHATHTKTHGMLDNVYEYTCEQASCMHATSGLRGYDPQTLEHAYAGGITVYNSSCISGTPRGGALSACAAYHGKHAISYGVALHNLDASSGIRTGDARAYIVHNSTEPLIVRYDPVFSEQYAYVSLGDDSGASGNWAWSKRHVIAVAYEGSAGGGRDDPDTAPHELRRALLNAFDYSGSAIYVTGKIPISTTLAWNATAGPSSRDGERCDSYDPRLLDGAFMFSRNADSAMFTQAAYGRLYMSYPISEFMHEHNAQTATLHNTIQTSMFAGQNLRDLISYNYTYPAARFGVPASIVMMDPHGLVAHGSVFANITPIPYRSAEFASGGDVDSDAPSYLHDHVCSNVLAKTGDMEIANMVVSDMYPRTMTVRADSGGRVDFVLNRTSVIFTDVYALLARSVSELDINTIYEAPSAYNFEYAVADGGMRHTRNMTSEVTFTSPVLEVANIYDDNVLDYVVSCMDCSHTTLQLRPQIGFGDIVLVEHNGDKAERVCSTKHGCTLSAIKGQNNTIRVTNTWGGTAHASLFVPDVDPTMSLSANPVGIATAVAIGIAAVTIWRTSSKIMNYIRIITGTK